MILHVINSPDQYKVYPCQEFISKGYCPTYEHCLYYHSFFDKRRPPVILHNSDGIPFYNYSPIICPDITHSTCSPDCKYSHNFYERTYHPLSPPVFTNCLYKVFPCIQTTDHSILCTLFHNYQDRRRFPLTYSSQICSYNGTNLCPNGDFCFKAHNKMEKLYHPEKYKTRFCNEKPICKHGILCCYAHSDEELNAEILHKRVHDEGFYMYLFKTVWCPFNYGHNKAFCEYAHNWQDFRRRLDAFKYRNLPCPNWNKNGFIRSYSEGCPYGAMCSYSHGWMELHYHPNSYRCMMCMAKEHLIKHCYMFHSQLEMRSPCYMTLCNTVVSKRSPQNNINDQIVENMKKGQLKKLIYISFDEQQVNELGYQYMPKSYTDEFTGLI